MNHSTEIPFVKVFVFTAFLLDRTVPGDEQIGSYAFESLCIALELPPPPKKRKQEETQTKLVRVGNIARNESGRSISSRHSCPHSETESREIVDQRQSRWAEGV